MTGVTADQHHNRTEAKVTAGAAPDEAVAWTAAFAAVPVVTTAADENATNTGRISSVRSRSTTGATVCSYSHDGTLQSVVKYVIAQEAT